MRAVLIALLAAAVVGLALAAMHGPALLVLAAVLVVAFPVSLMARVLLAAFAAAGVIAGAVFVWADPWLLAAVAAAVSIRPGIGAWRFARSSPAARRHWPLMMKARLRWRWLCRNVKLAPVDFRTKHAARGESAPTGPVGSAVTFLRGPEASQGQIVGRIHYPRATRWRADAYGFTVSVRTVPGVGLAEVEKSAGYMADYWRCVRVGVGQPKPGRLVIRGVRRDPLAEALPGASLPPFDGRRWYLGRDEWGDARYADLANLSGSVVGGAPGRGKSQFGTAAAVQLAPVANSSWYVLDGGGGADWDVWEDRAERFATDDLEQARDVLEEANARMVKRLATLAADLGTRNAWRIGPTEAYPLVWVVLDEASVYLDLDAAKTAGKAAETQVRAIRSLVTGMLRRGRKVMFHTTLLVQKASQAGCPPDIRDLAGLRLSFGVTTTEQAVSVLGDDIRQHPTLSPVQLQTAEYAGAAVARIPTGLVPFSRIRTPFVTEDQADAVALATVQPALATVTRLPLAQGQ